MKSVPEPSALMRRSGRWRSSLRSSADLASAIFESCRRCQTVILVSGSSMSRATPLMNCSSVCEPPMESRPRSLPSVLM